MGLIATIERWQRSGAAKSDPTKKAEKMPDYRGSNGNPRVRDWKHRQRQLKQAAQTLGYDTLEPGEHSPDGAVTVGLLCGEIVTVYLAGWAVGVLDEEDSQWVTRWVKRHTGGDKARVDARLYHYEHGRWGVILTL